MIQFFKQNIVKISFLIFFCALLYFPIFIHLENLAIRKYDEARLAANAYEMSMNRNYFVTTYNGDPDLWNTKPPLMIWSQVFFIKLFGYNELSIRLPAALASLLTCFLLILFANYYLKKFVFGIIAASILITSSGFIGIHLSRTGDYDALLTLFTTFYILCFFIYCESSDKKIKDKALAFFFLGISLAVLTKGVAGLLFTPALLIYLLVRKQFVITLKSKKTYLFLFGFMLLAGGFYVIRELLNPGYIDAVFKNELGGRFLETLESHKHGPFFFIDFITDTAFRYWYLFVLPGLAFGFVSKENRMKNFAVLITLVSLCYLLVISNSQTKIFWYIMPAMPFLALAAAMFFYWLYSAIKNLRQILPASRYNIAPQIMLFLVFWIPYSTIYNEVSHPKELPRDNETYSICYYLRDAIQGKRNLSGSTILHENYSGEIMFYIHQLNEKGQNIRLENINEINLNDTVIVYESELSSKLTNLFETEIIDHKKNVIRYRVIAACN